tara:strand:- start:1455 stop:2366 length:912 start_codon:yes stop_codon:yes gene_type:complete
MPTFSRTTIVRGPAKVTYNSATFYSKGGISLTMTTSTFDKESDAYGNLGKSKNDFQVVVEFEPVGEIEELAVLFPYGGTAIGSSVFGAVDKPLVIVALDATYTIRNAAITQMPSIRCSANNTAFGSVQLTGILELAGDPSALTDYYAVAAGAALGTTFDPTKIVTSPYTATLGGSTTFFSEAGFEISFDLAMNPVMIDGIGTVDMSLQNVGCSISCIPVGIAESAFDTYFGSLDAGEYLASATLDISTATSGGLNFDVAAVQITELQKRFSPSENRLGQLSMSARRTFTTGNPNALFTVAAVV